MNDQVKEPAAPTGTGFAAAAQPVATQTLIHTGADGLDAARTELTIAGQAVPLYYARPAGKDKLPVVIVVAEIFGLHDTSPTSCAASPAKATWRSRSTRSCARAIRPRSPTSRR